MLIDRPAHDAWSRCITFYGPRALAAADEGDPIPLAIGIDEPLIEQLVKTRGFARDAAEK